ncbi:hypothetical protein N0V93_001902 [Gnomoniopsis smithogilvyi]|uniref:Protein phosphatase 4 core regulatory subunit R2 n=1 Tax=Gnomoniopsis smithogilvyi TaxID=1191159 RepID=A0A9W9D2M5_9PEZI|nr:hypothetical protein N0V93_001902 [Gnomoniopsis smithogilvyi]
MEMDTDAEENLRKLASGGTIDYSTWPSLLATVVSHIEKTALNDFPIPRIPQSTAAAPPPLPEPRFLAPLPPSSDPAEPTSSSSEIDPPANTTASGNESAGPSSQETNKENAAPANAPASTSTTSEPAPAPELEPGTLPPQITAMVAEITGVLNETFHTYPPHTIQRLAELVLEPRKHYRSLPSYLHAVDRVVHVTSGNNIYPLPPAIPDMSNMHINGVTEATSAHEDSSDSKPELPTQAIWASNSTGGAPIGSDEALGGALLTPIPWLARRAANGGDGSSESGESSTLGSEAGGTALAVGQGAGSNTSASSSPTSQQRQGRQFEMQVRTESTETIDGPNGMGSIETVSVSINGISSLSAAQQQRVITQGELIRQEQRAGVVPVSQLARSGPVVVTSNPAPSSTTAEEGADTTMGEGEGEGEAQKDTSSEKSDEDMADEEEAPHARGPDLIGAADMGPQKTGSSSTFSISHGGNVEVRGIDVEAAVGRKHESQVPSSHNQSEGAATSSDDSDGAAVLTPASSEVESATAADSTEQRGKGESSKDDSAAEEKAVADPPPEEMETEPKSATLSARSSPVKREADTDISDAESEAKRLKSATPEEDATSAAAPAAPAEAETAPSEAAGKDETEAQPESTDEGEGKGDNKPADEEMEKQEDASEPAPADSAD